MTATARLISTETRAQITLEEILRTVLDGEPPVRVTAFDGTDIGPSDTDITLDFVTPEALRYAVSAPGDLGLARAYLTGGLEVRGIHPGDPYPLLAQLREMKRRPLSVSEIGRLATALSRSYGASMLTAPPPPPQESLPRWRRGVEQVRNRAGRVERSSAAIKHHYDVGNSFYERVLGPSMAYTCAVYTSLDDTLEQAQQRKFELVADKLALRSGMTLLDVGCGWGGMVREAARRGVKALGFTLSREQAEWANAAIERDGLSHLAEVRHGDYREAPAQEFDAVSSIGLTEHIGLRHYPSYFAFLLARLRVGGRLLNHCITRADGHAKHRPDAFIERYVFPDGELSSPANVIAQAHDAGFEVQHCENLRMHYAHTLAAWCENLQRHWEYCVSEAGEATAKVWGLYMAGSRLAFETGGLQLHQVLATKPGPNGVTTYPLRPDWTA